MNFVEEQLGIIDEYEEKINNYNSTNSNYESIIKEKNEALKQIQTSQNNFKNNFGMLPMTEEFNNKVANIMDLILEQKVKDIKNNNYINDLSNSNVSNRKSLEQNKKSSGSFNLDENAISKKQNFNNNNYNNDIAGCAYKSKYEELKESIFNGEDISEELKTSISLIGDSKFVVQNKLVKINDKNNNIDLDNQNLSDLYTTWKEQNFNNINNNEINSNMKSNISKNEEFKIEELNNNNEDTSNNNINNQKIILGDSSEDILIKNNNNANNNININNDYINSNNNINNLNINDSYMDKVNEALNKNSQKISKKEKNKSILLTSQENNPNNINKNNNIDNLNINNSTEDFLNMDKIEYPNFITTKESQDASKSINNISNNLSNINSFQYYNSINNQLKNNKTAESDENVIIGNISLNTTLKNSTRNNTNFNNTGKANTLVKEMKLNEVEEKAEEELYESEFREDAMKKIDEEENYEKEFENEDLNEIKKLEEEDDKNKVNLEDYKEIHESQKIQTQLNFFEDSILDNININKSRGHIVGNINNTNSEKIDDSENKNENKNVLMSSELKDSYGDNILKNLNKYRKMALGESSMSQNEQ